MQKPRASDHAEHAHHLIDATLHEEAETGQHQSHPDCDDRLHDRDDRQADEQEDDPDHPQQTECIEHVSACTGRR